MYDLAIIGGGPAGYVAAEKAGKAGLKVILFENKKLGGVCLNEGCIPTKTLLYSAKIYDNVRDASKYGIVVPEVSFDFSAIMSRKNNVVSKLVSGIVTKMKSSGVEVINGYALIKSRETGKIIIESGNQLFECRKLLIATGSEAFVPPIKGIDKTKIYTNRELLNIDKIPQSITIIGGGVIGMEFASFFSSMGVKVNVVEMMPEILPGIDPDLSSLLRKEQTKKGVSFYLGSKVTEVNGNEVFFENSNSKTSVTSEIIFVGVGRKANIHGFGLETLSVDIEKGGIKIDKNCRTNQPDVYAAGDVTGFSMLAHTASREAEVAVNHILGRKDSMRYNAVPGVVYTNPEISVVGLTETEAKKLGIETIVKTLPMAYSGRFIAENEGKSGICKIVAGKKYKEILGVHMIGNPSSEMIYGAAIAIENQMRLTDLEEIIFPHPTVSEIIRETILH